MLPLSMALCAICRSADLVVPCMTCNRPQCRECYSPEDDFLRFCKGCRMEKDLEMDFLSESPLSKREEEQEEEQEEEREEEQEEKQSSPPLRLHRTMMYPHPQAGPVELLEIGVRRFASLLYPTYLEWKHAENILVGHIQFTTSSYGVQQPWIFTKYLVGQMTHRFVNHSSLTTDYMLAYEPDLVNPGHFVWRKYISTYYNKSPIPYDENIFFPYPLPLQFHL